MIRKISASILCLILLNQFGLSQGITKLKIDFEKANPVKLSEIVSEVRYIPLETNPDCLIGYMNIPVYGKDIIVRSYTGSVNGSVGTFRFSDQGKFLNKIGNLGRGPGEYQDNNDVVLVGDTVFIVSNFSNDILCYSLNGKFLKKYHLDLNSRPKNIVQLKDKSFMISLTSPSDYGILLNTDGNFKPKRGFIKNVPIKENPFSYGFEKSKDKIYYYHNYIDTIFEISKGYPIGEIIIDYGKYRISNEKRSINDITNVILNRPSVHIFNACDNYFKTDIYYPFKEGIYTVLYKISDGKQITWSQLINDIDNGTMERWRGFLSGNSLIFHLLPTTIIERYKKLTAAEKNDPKNSAFVKMASKITLESNPVIMICKLK